MWHSNDKKNNQSHRVCWENKWKDIPLSYAIGVSMSSMATNLNDRLSTCSNKEHTVIFFHSGCMEGACELCTCECIDICMSQEHMLFFKSGFNYKTHWDCLTPQLATSLEAISSKACCQLDWWATSLTLAGSLRMIRRLSGKAHQLIRLCLHNNTYILLELAIPWIIFYEL